jgi:hypothetical protein
MGLWSSAEAAMGDPIAPASVAIADEARKLRRVGDTPSDTIILLERFCQLSRRLPPGLVAGSATARLRVGERRP